MTGATPLRLRRVLRGMAILATVMLAACGLPRSGPNKKEIYSGAVERGGHGVAPADVKQPRRAAAQPQPQRRPERM